MFPDQLDNAKVLLFTSKGNYGIVKYTDGTIAHEISYLSICQYDNDPKYYLFMCDDKFGVVSDSLWDSVEECQQVAANSCGVATWITK